MSSHDPLSRRGLRALLADLDWPATTVAGRPRVARAGWQHFVDGSTPTDRHAAIVALHPALLRSTEHARTKLDAWQRDFTPLPTDVTEPEIREWVRDSVVHVGDEAFDHDIADALARTPEPVRAWTLRHCAFVTVGRGSIAWTARSRVVDRDGRPRERFIVLGPGAAANVILHEIGHAWCDAPPQSSSGSAALTTRAEAGAVSYFREVGVPVDDLVARSERIAWALALVWLGGAR